MQLFLVQNMKKWATWHLCDNSFGLRWRSGIGIAPQGTTSWARSALASPSLSNNRWGENRIFQRKKLKSKVEGWFKLMTLEEGELSCFIFVDKLYFYKSYFYKSYFYKLYSIMAEKHFTLSRWVLQCAGYCRGGGPCCEPQKVAGEENDSFQFARIWPKTFCIWYNAKSLFSICF